MVQIQPTNIGLQIPRKRKHPETGARDGEDSHAQIWPEPSRTATTIVNTLPGDGGNKARRTTRKNRPELKRSASSTFIESEIPWPDHFKRLNQAHRALNLVYTFCCTRKSFATTFENIKSTVESNLKRSFEIEDISQMKVLVKDAITFKYVSESLLQVNLIGAEQGHRYRRIGDAPPFETVGNEGDEDKQVLLFEFNDGDLKRQVQNKKTGEAERATTKLRNEELKMPVYSQKQMLTLIEKRNKKFTSAINGFLNDCAESDLDAVEILKTQSKDCIPQIEEDTKPKPEDLQAPLPPSIPAERKTIPEIIADMKSLTWYTGQIVPDGHRVFDPQEPIYGELKFELSQNLVNALYNTRGIERLFAHQAEAINNLHDGNNVIVATSTSSGKSLIYQIPVIHELEQNPQARAMYIFPTKALAQDQRRSLKDIMQYMPGLENLVVETFDGDTDKQDRAYIRDEARIIFTNPDMLHITILPQEESWRSFLQNLKYVVVDELHVYNGLFGSHVAFIMRRLRRICAAVGNRHIKFISCSATVANPEEHMKTIFGVKDVKLTDFDGSPSGRKEFVCWNTPYKDPGDPTSGRGDTMMEAARLICQLVLRGVRVIAFTRIRKACELLLNCVKHEMGNLGRPHEMARVMAYRGGYTPQDRRVIEKEMFEGKLMGIIATSALELGIDIGSLDAVVTVGFPYTIANLRQQSGRAGRRNKDSMSVLVGDCFPTDQYFMDNPDEIFTRPNCELQVDLRNMLVVEGHVQCAAYEMPIRPEEDEQYFDKQLEEICDERLDKDDLGFYHCSSRYRPQPSKFVAIRDTEDEHFAVVNITNGANEVLEDLEASRAFFTLYEGGIFLHQGNTYLVKSFSQERMIAEVVKVKVDWVTQQRDYTDIDPIEVEAVRRIPDTKTRTFYGVIKCMQVVYGFFKLDKRRRILDAVEVDNPPIILFSKGMWIDVPKQAIEILKSHRLNIAAGIHAAEHAILSLMPNYVISMPGDVKTECKISEKELSKKETKRKRPARLTFYDAKGGAGGSGISTKAFEFVDLLLRQACERVLKCHCTEGCLECCASERCKDANRIMSKVGSEVILKSLLNMEIDVDALPWGEEDVPEGIETVVIAEEVRPKRGHRVEVVEVKREGGGTTRVPVGAVVGEADANSADKDDDDVVVVKDEPID